MAVRNRLKDIRHDFRMDQKEFSEFIGVNYYLYNRWENNKSQPNSEWLLKIGKKTEQTIESIIYLDPDE